MASEAANEHVGEIKVDDNTKDIDVVCIERPIDVEVKDETNKTEDASVEAEEKPDTKETATLVEEPKKNELEDNYSALKQSVENEILKDKSIADDSSKEEVDVLPADKAESETTKELPVSETVAKGIECVQQTQELSAERDTSSVEEEKNVKLVTTSVAQDIVSDDFLTIASSELPDIAKNEKSTTSSLDESSKEEVDVLPVEKTKSETIKELTVSETVAEEIENVKDTQELSAESDTLPVEEKKNVEPVTTSVAQDIISDDAIRELPKIPKDEKSTTDALDVNSKSTNEDTPINDKPEQSTEIATVPAEITDTEIAEASVVTEVSNVIIDAKEVSEVVTDPNPGIPSKDLKESGPAAGAELTTDTTTVTDNPEGIVEKKIIVEQEKQDYNAEGEKPPTVLDDPASEAPTTSSASETIDIAPDENTAAKELELIPEPITEVHPMNDELQVVNENPSSEPHETAEAEKLVATDSSEVTDAKEVGEKIIAEVPDVVKTDEDANDSVGSKESAANVSAVATESEKLVAADSSEVADTKQVAEKIIAEVPDVEKTDENAGASVGSKESAANVPALDKTVSFDQAPVTEITEGKSEEMVEVEKSKEEDVAKVEKSTLVEAVETFVSHKIATVTDEAKASISESLLIEKEGLVDEKTNLVEASREFDVTGVIDKSTATLGEAKEVEIEQKQTGVKQTLLEKFANETSESKKEEETAKAVEESVSETVTATESANQKTDEQTPTKTSQRHSNSIMSKVKQSIVKVKKAIIGKSPSSKTIQTDAKDDTKA